jgi:NAD(P)H-dependent FMN reductase
MTPHVVCLAGTLRAPSRLNRVIHLVAAEFEHLGMRVTVFDGASLMLPMYHPDLPTDDAAARFFLEAIADADGIVLGSPTYHGSVSGLLKNALDHINDLEFDPRPFLDGRPVGCITVASGQQGAVTALTTLRIIVHALRGWPTPLGITLGTPDEAAENAQLEQQIPILVSQVARLAVLSARSRARKRSLANPRTVEAGESGGA